MDTDAFQDPLIAIVERVPEGPRPVRLPPQSSLDACPKCGSESLRTTYHDGLHLAGPCGKLYGEMAQARDWDFPEHLCVQCGNCRYGWAEQVRLKG